MTSSSVAPKVALIGIGNIMFNDEGLGAYSVKYIEENYHLPENLKILEGGTLGFKLMTYYQEYDHVVVVGSSSSHGEAGGILVQSSSEVLTEGKVKKSANEVEITMMLEICSFHEEMGEVDLITMIPQDIIEVRNGVTPEVLAALPNLVETIVSHLGNLGLSLEKNVQNEVSFEEVIDSYANPTQSPMRA